MPANKMPEMPEAPAGLKGWLSSHQQDLLREYIEMHGRACYLAGIEAARACVPSSLTETLHSGSFQAGFETACIEMDHRLTNLTALEQEAKK